MQKLKKLLSVWKGAFLLWLAAVRGANFCCKAKGNILHFSKTFYNGKLSCDIQKETIIN
jgi:hypothetical protein